VRFTWPGVRWDAPVCVDLLSGAVSDARPANGELKVALADYPYALVERAHVDLL
jgi:hypothetical protein